MTRRLKTTLALLAAGAGLHLVTAVFLGKGNVGFRVALCAWSLAPYLLASLALWHHIRGIFLFLAVIAILSIDTIAFSSVFLVPKNSSAALILLAAPFWNMLSVALAIIVDRWLARRR